MAALVILAILGSFSSTRASDDIGTICQVLWNADTNSLRYGIDFDISLQTKLPYNNVKDKSSGKLFTRLDETRLNTRSWKAFKALLNNYIANTGNTEQLTKSEMKENDEFLSAVMATSTMKELHRHLVLKGLAPSSESSFKLELKKIWLYFYRRKAYRDSSGFEHVFLGELKKDNNGVTMVTGFHNWLHFYLEEKKNNLANYHGYYSVQPYNDPASIKLQLSWHRRLKKVTGFFLGTSPEFELALYTACFKLKPNQSCQCNIGGQPITIKTYIYTSTGLDHVGSAFPLV